jgi:hypothetical protein
MSDLRRDAKTNSPKVNSDPYGRPKWALDLRDRTKECHYCNDRISRKTATIDHKMPVNLGGRYTKDNIAIACRPCNLLKGGDMTSTTFIHLLKELGPTGIQKMKDDLGLDKPRIPKAGKTNHKYRAHLNKKTFKRSNPS